MGRSVIQSIQMVFKQKPLRWRYNTSGASATDETIHIMSRPYFASIPQGPLILQLLPISSALLGIYRVRITCQVEVSSSLLRYRKGNIFWLRCSCHDGPDPCYCIIPLCSVTEDTFRILSSSKDEYASIVMGRVGRDILISRDKWALLHQADPVL